MGLIQTKAVALAHIWNKVNSRHPRQYQVIELNSTITIHKQSNEKWILLAWLMY